MARSLQHTDEHRLQTEQYPNWYLHDVHERHDQTVCRRLRAAREDQ